MQQIFIIKGFQVLRLIILILILSYFLGTFWFIMTMHSTKSPDEFTFYNEDNLADKTNAANMTIMIYYMFTTLSSVGLGDFNPKSETERLIITFILLIGCTCFSYIMSQFIEIVVDLKYVMAENENSEMMSKWLKLMQNFNNNKPLPKEMTNRFEKYFAYYWYNDRNYAMVSEEDKKVCRELPYTI